MNAKKARDSAEINRMACILKAIADTSDNGGCVLELFDWNELIGDHGYIRKFHYNDDTLDRLEKLGFKIHEVKVTSPQAPWLLRLIKGTLKEKPTISTYHTITW